MSDRTSTPTSQASSGRPSRWIKRTGTTIISVTVVAVAILAFAEYRTSQPGFCGRCHIMEPYYDSWEADVHGTKFGVKCVDCHYAPGEKTTIKAKMRGLSQLASYVSGRYGATRPRAHVSNDSCMTAKCHGDGRFLEKDLMVGTVRFQHAKHLKIDTARRQEIERELEQISTKLRGMVGPERFEELRTVARQSNQFGPRVTAMANLAHSWGIEIAREDLEHLTQLEHRPVRWAQLDELQCTSCHTYATRDTNEESPGKSAHHFRVNKTSCYTCHFNNEGFNTGTNTCLNCHNLPTKEILVHKDVAADGSEKPAPPADNGTEKPAAKPGDADASKLTVKMNHQTILERKVNCISCHADVAGEDSDVMRRDCESCHDQPKYFEKFQKPMSVDVVAEYHRAHVPNQRAKCLDCHSEIHHQLARTKSQEGAPGFLTQVMSDCKHCHPNHHAEQIALLRGEGGIGVPKSSPNTMFGSRTNCYGCHQSVSTDAHGGLVTKATEAGCVACHGDRHSATFEKWKAGIELMLTDAEEAYNAAHELYDASTDVPEAPRRRAGALLNAAKSDLRLVKVGNGLHNTTYAIELLDAVTQRCQEVTSVLNAAKPAAPEKSTEEEKPESPEKPAEDSKPADDAKPSGDAKPDAESPRASEDKPAASESAASESAGAGEKPNRAAP